jgi:hypothetical protein
MRHIDHLDRLDFPDFKVSVKASDVFMAVAAYRELANRSSSRCTWASPRRGACAPAPSSHPSAWACC